MRNPQKQLSLVVELIRRQSTLSLASAGEDGQASVAPLFYLPGPDLSLCWLSAQTSLHSIHLARSPRVAVAIHSNVFDWKEIRGVQMRGSAARVTRQEQRAALAEAYCDRFKLGRVLRLAVRKSAFYLFEPDFLRYIDNAKRFGYRFELTRGPQGWSLTRP